MAGIGNLRKEGIAMKCGIWLKHHGYINICGVQPDAVEAMEYLIASIKDCVCPTLKDEKEIIREIESIFDVRVFS